jgi:predicted Zn finger-like uncharacterized protein
MQVSCESCGARYQLDDSRFSGRGARITCPRCQHVFVVYREEDLAEDQDPQEAVTTEVASAVEYKVDDLDFRKVGIKAWKVKVKIGLVYDFSDYKTLAKYITDGRVTMADKISHDGKEWTEIGTIPDLAQYFIDVYIAEEQALNPQPEVDGVGEFDGDEPTDIFGLQQAEKAKAKAKKARRASKPAKKPATEGPGVDDELMKMAQNLSKDMATGDAEPASGPPRFVDPFEARQRKKRADEKQEATDLSDFTPLSSDEQSSGGRSKMLIIALFAVAAAASIYIVQVMQEDAAGPETAANQGARNRAGREAVQAANQAEAAEAAAAEAAAAEDASSAYGGFTTGDGSTNAPVQCDESQLVKTPNGELVCPLCIVEGNCGDSAGIQPAGQNGPEGPGQNSGTAEGAEANYEKAMALRGSFTDDVEQNQIPRQKALGFMDKAVDGDGANLSYRVSRAELLLFRDNAQYVCSTSGAEWRKGVADLKVANPERNPDAAYLYGIYFLLCANNKEQAAYYLEIGKESRQVGWGQRASEEIEILSSW